MANNNATLGGVEWREKMPDGTSRKLETECGFINAFYLGIKGIFLGMISIISNFLNKAYDIAKSEPRKIIHCIKVGLALSVVSSFYYTRPLYEGVGGNAMWAVMTVVVVFEYTVGQMLSKCINRVTATFLAGSLGIGVNWVATQCGQKYEPVIVGLSVFLLASSATFSRFIPTFKARFDYGVVIFILTFSLVSVSGYRVDKLFMLAQDRLITIAIGTSICVIIGLVCFPVWAGSELHLIIHNNMDKLADSLDGYVEEYFNDEGDEKAKNKEESNKKLQGYKSVLNSKATEDTLANNARWEPAHGTFNFRHPWKQYLKIAAQMRSCACGIESLANCINSELQAPDYLKRSLSDISERLSSQCSKVLKDSAETIKTMTKSSTIDLSVREMHYLVQQLQNTIESLPQELISENDTEEQKQQPVLINLIEILPLAATTTILIEIAGKVEGIVDAIDELADLAEFKPAKDEKSKQGPSNMDKIHDDDDETIKVFQKV